MGALTTAALAASLWIVASLLWSGAVYLACRQRSTSSEAWPWYWLACVVIATAPPLLAPIFVAAPLAAVPAQLDAAIALANWTAPLQRHGLALDVGAAPIVLITLGVFGLGLVFQLTRLVITMQRVCLVVRGAKPIEGFRGAGVDDVRLLTSEACVPVFCVGGKRASVILSRATIEKMSDAQVRMIVRHEIAHLRRRDPALFLALELLDVVFWFNPFVRRLTAQTRLAAEIACDAIAIEATGASRKTYANTFVSALEADERMSSGAIAAFGRRGDASRVRLSHILDGGVARRLGRLTSVFVIVALALSLSSAALAASTVRMAVFGDATLLSGLQARVSDMYHAPRCAAPSSADLRSVSGLGRRTQ